jgi:TetR/AcrR family transcriptional regulator, cholesterol catabolism regulator
MSSSRSNAPRKPRSRVRTVARETVSGVYRDAILAAAFHEFTDRGYAATKMVDVAHRAGMSVGALYRHFDSKEAIFVSLMERGGVQIQERLGGIAAGGAAARMTKLIETMLAHIEENRGMFLVFSQLRDADKAACRALVEQAHCTRDIIFASFKKALADGIADGTFRDDIPLDDQLAFVTGAMHGFLEAWIRSNGQDRLVVKAPLIARLTLRALSGGPS